MTNDDLIRDDLKVTPAEAFGQPGSLRRKVVLEDLGSQAIALADGLDVEDVAGLTQKTGAALPEIGERYYVKTMNIPERARNEALANHLYELLGVPVPDVAVGADGKTVSSKLIGDKFDFDVNNPAHRKAAQQGFVADAFLANWDAIGLSYDNIQIDPDGNAWRIDAGGALAYRAQGKPKGAMFGGDVGELASLTNPSINYNAAQVYSDISKSDLQAQGEMIRTIYPAATDEPRRAVRDARDRPGPDRPPQVDPRPTRHHRPGPDPRPRGADTGHVGPEVVGD